MPFDPKGIATQLVNEKLGGDGEDQGETENMEEDGVHEMWKDLIDAIHAKDHVAAANIHRGIFQTLESEPHSEYDEGEPEKDDGYSSGGVATGGGRLSSFPNPFGSKLPGKV
jgi:hypothetical protein